ADNRALHPFPTRRSSDLETLREDLVRANLGDSVGPLAALTITLQIHGFAATAEVSPPSPGAPAWSDSMLTPAARDALAGPYRRGDRKSTRLNSSHDQSSY